MQHDDANGHTGAPMVQAAHQPSAGYLGENVAKAVVGITWSGRVVEGQHGAGKRLDQDQKKRDTSEDLMPACRGGNFFIQKVVDGRFETGAMVKGFDEVVEALVHRL